MLSIGCGDPTRAICSTLIAQAFASIHYPILPERASINGKTYAIAPYVQSEIDHIRTYGLYTPRDFDVSPYLRHHQADAGRRASTIALCNGVRLT